MTKAERRELQEKQRAAKAAKAAALPSAPNPKQGNKPSQQSAASKKGPDIAAAAAKTPKDAKVALAVTSEAVAEKARGLRIFSHFGLPKPVSAAKGDIHPAVVRLALQFSNFKITGANARCIATLTAFKTVRDFACALSRASFSLGHTRLRHSA